MTLLGFVKLENCLLLLAAFILANWTASFCWAQKDFNPQIGSLRLYFYNSRFYLFILPTLIKNLCHFCLAHTALLLYTGHVLYVSVISAILKTSPATIFCQRVLVERCSILALYIHDLNGKIYSWWNFLPWGKGLKGCDSYSSPLLQSKSKGSADSSIGIFIYLQEV